MHLYIVVAASHRKHVFIQAPSSFRAKYNILPVRFDRTYLRLYIAVSAARLHRRSSPVIFIDARGSSA